MNSVNTAVNIKHHLLWGYDLLHVLAVTWLLKFLIMLSLWLIPADFWDRCVTRISCEDIVIVKIDLIKSQKRTSCAKNKNLKMILFTLPHKLTLSKLNSCEAQFNIYVLNNWLVIHVGFNFVFIANSESQS